MDSLPVNYRLLPSSADVSGYLAKVVFLSCLSRVAFLAFTGPINDSICYGIIPAQCELQPSFGTNPARSTGAPELIFKHSTEHWTLNTDCQAFTVVYQYNAYVISRGIRPRGYSRRRPLYDAEGLIFNGGCVSPACADPGATLLEYGSQCSLTRDTIYKTSRMWERGFGLLPFSSQVYVFRNRFLSRGGGTSWIRCVSYTILCRRFCGRAQVFIWFLLRMAIKVRRFPRPLPAPTLSSHPHRTISVFINGSWNRAVL